MPPHATVISSIAETLSTGSASDVPSQLRVAPVGPGGVRRPRMTAEYTARARHRTACHGMFGIYAGSRVLLNALHDDRRRRPLACLRCPRIQLANDELYNGRNDGWMITLNNASDREVFYCGATRAMGGHSGPIYHRQNGSIIA
ncbi:hypothetical protein B0T16DRAFT_248888 [Cercophora newfieldiana]|uniref:Uncharacterized protein n=1 Tax=Cercophora newfieldiana TaxID=92897 RepID=A0AA39XTB7_9PEZI|nr:hypothetical protein B0T16DRAFT_248888 [Cercophora newfieldiana]